MLNRLLMDVAAPLATKSVLSLGESQTYLQGGGTYELRMPFSHIHP